jgi:hypothetical protein
MVSLPDAVKAEIVRGGSEKRDYRHHSLATVLARKIIETLGMNHPAGWSRPRRAATSAH